MNRVCEQCATEFNTKDNRKRFCGRSCSATFNNTGRRRHGIAPNLCLLCGEKCRRGGPKTQYCSTAHRQQHEVELWLAGELSGNWKYTYAAYVKRYLEERSGLVCEMEGCNEQRKKSNGSHILQVDHIDGNWSNNRPENVRLICPSCHSLTDTWGAGNMGNGRKWRATYSQY